MTDRQKNIPTLRAIATPERATSVKARESWQMWGIISEFVEASERLSEIRPAVSIFGSARTQPGTPRYELTMRIARTLSDAGFAVLGISPDSPAKLAKFRDRDGLTFPLLSDPDHAVLAAYGAYGEKMLYGKKTVGVIRSTFVVGADGLIERAYYAVKATGHVARLRKDLGLDD